MHVFSKTQQKSAMTIYHAGYNEAATAECLVWFRGEGQTLFVVYTEEDGGEIQYVGRDSGGGHYAVEWAKYEGHGTLHLWRKPVGEITLEGSWWQEGAEGMWRIALGGYEPEFAG